MQNIVNLAFKKQAEDIDRTKFNFEKLVSKMKNEFDPSGGTRVLIGDLRAELMTIKEQHMILQKSVEELKRWE